MLARASGPLDGNHDLPKRIVLWASSAAIVFLCFWYVFDIILLAFAGGLLAIILHACADWVQRHTPRGIGLRLSYTATILGIVILACLIGYWIVPDAISETRQMVHIIPKSLAEIGAYLDKTDWGRRIERAAHHLLSSSTSGSKIGAITGDIGHAVEYVIVIVVVGLYGALNGPGYGDKLLSVMPERRRESVLRISRGIIYTLRWWLIGQLIPMAVLGVVTMIGLWALGVPLAFALGLLTGAMIFIPYVGSWIAFVPTILVSLTKGVETAIYVAILYLVVHLLEGYALTPMVQKRAVLLPPELTILALLFMWTVSGLLGAALATPIAAALFSLGKMLYLHEDVEKEGKQE